MSGKPGDRSFCPDCYREINGGASRPKRSFIARHWYLTRTLILINVVVYGLQQIIPFRWVHNLGMMSGPRVHHDEYYRLITHGFVHLQNDRRTCCGTWFTSSSSVCLLERMMGRWKFLFVYMAAILGSGISVYLFDYYRGAVGASGGECTDSTVRSSSFCFFGNRRDTALLFMLLIGIGVVRTFFNPNISHAGHFGGFVGGVLATC